MRGMNSLNHCKPPEHNYPFDIDALHKQSPASLLGRRSNNTTSRKLKTLLTYPRLDREGMDATARVSSRHSAARRRGRWWYMRSNRAKCQELVSCGTQVTSRRKQCIWARYDKH